MIELQATAAVSWCPVGHSLKTIFGMSTRWEGAKGVVRKGAAQQHCCLWRDSRDVSLTGAALPGFQVSRADAQQESVLLMLRVA